MSEVGQDARAAAQARNEAATVAMIHECRRLKIAPGKVGSAGQWGLLAAAALAAADRVVPLPPEPPSALQLLREWFDNDAEPQFHHVAEDDPGGIYCNECGGELPCYVLRTKALLENDTAAAPVSLPAPKLDAIEKRADAASPGPWQTEPNTHAGRVWVQRSPAHHRMHGEDCEPLFSVRGKDEYEQREKDAEFIAHARTDVPSLVAEVRRLRAALREYDAASGQEATKT